MITIYTYQVDVWQVENGKPIPHFLCEAAKKELFTFLNKDSEKKGKNGFIVLTLEIKHGDIVVVHGERIQEIYEHAVRPIIRTTKIRKVLRQMLKLPTIPLDEDIPVPYSRHSMSGRSRGARTWEFYCDSDARNALTEQAEREESGSATAAFEMIRSQISDRKHI